MIPSAGPADPVLRRTFTLAGWLALAGFLVMRAFSPIESFDFWWHLETGEWILQNGKLPAADPFSFTAGGTPWIDHSWLFQAAMFLLHGAGGFPALGAFRLLLLLAAVGCIGIHLHRERVPGIPSGLLVGFVLWGACFRLTIRPDLISVCFTAILLCLLFEFRRSGRWGPLGVAAILLPLWANLHVGALLAPLVLLPFALEPFLFPPGPRGPGRVGLLPAGLWGWSLVAIGLNPWLWRPYGVALGLTRMTGREYARNLEWARPEVADFPLFYLSLALFVILPVVGRRLAVFPGMAVAGMLGGMSLLSLRFLGIYFLALPFFCAPYLRGGTTAGGRWGSGRRIAAPVGSAALVLLGALLLLHAARHHPPGADFRNPRRFPVGAVEFLRDHRVAAEHLFNDVKFGGFLIWSRFPEHRVFIDGRNEVYPGLLREIHAALASGPAWKELMDRYRIDAALLRYPSSLSPVIYPAADGRPARRDHRPFSTLYFPREEWALVHWDDAAMLFLRRLPGNRAVIEATEYQAIRPDDQRHLAARAGRDGAFRQAVLGELERKLREDPACRRARDLYDRFAAVSGLTRNVNR